MPKIFLSESEIRVLAAEFHRLKTTIGGKVNELAPKANKILAPDRQKPMRNAAQCSFASTAHKKWLAKGQPAPRESVRLNEGRTLEGLPFANKDQAAPPVNGAAHPAAPTDAGDAEVFYIEKVVVIREQPDWGRIPTADLARILIQRLDNQDQLIKAVERASDLAGIQRAVETTYSPEMDLRPDGEKVKDTKAIRVLVLGLDEAKFAELEKVLPALPKKISLQSRGRKPGGDQTMPDIVDYVIKTGKAKRAWDDQLATSGVKYPGIFSVIDDLQALKQKLFDICSLQTGQV